MKRLLLLTLSISLLTAVSYAQSIYKMNPSNNGKTFNVCKGMFTSSGFLNQTAPPVNSYSIADNGNVMTFCSGGGPIRVNFNYLNLIYAGEKLDVYDGNSTSAPLLASLTGWSNDHKFVTSTGTCLTFKFTCKVSTTTNGTVNPYGWQAFIGCVPSGCNGNSPASDICNNAPVICNLDGYCGTTSGWYTADNVATIQAVLSGCGGGGMTVQNNSWMAFIAKSTTATFNISSTNCTDGSNGIQAAILESNNCSSFTLKSNCVYNSRNFTLTASALTPGKKYYIMFDGATGNDCDYTVSAQSGIETVSLSSTASTICEGEPVTLTASSGTAFKWLPGGQTTKSITVYPSTTTTYTCEVTGTCDVVQKPTIKVNVKKLPVISATPASQSFCSGGQTSITLNSSLSPTTFNVVANATNVSGSSSGAMSTISQILTNSSSTTGTVTYKVTPTSGGCTGNSLDVPVTVYPLPTVTTTPSSQTLCSGGTTNIALSSNITGATFSWTVSATGVSGAFASNGTSISQTLTATGTVPGSVTYEITPISPAPANCTGTKKTVTITVNPSPTITPTVTSQTLCSGQTTSIGLQSNIPGTTFSWTIATTGGLVGAADGTGSNIIQTLNTSGTTTGTVEYTITATTPAPANCTNSSITKVLVTVYPIPTISINTPAAICKGQSVNLTATVDPANGTYLWTPGNANTATITVSPTTSTSYNVLYTVNGCSKQESRTVTVNPLPTVTVNASTTSICKGKSTILTASSADAGTCSWNPGGATSNSITVFPVNNTIYTVTFTNSTTGCQDTASKAITVKPLPTLAVTPTLSAICAGQSTTLNTTVNPINGTYSWSPGGAATPSITVFPTVTTTYTLTYTAPNGCSDNNSSTTITVTPKDNADFAYPSPTYCTGGATDPAPTIAGLAGGTFSSSPAGLSLNTSTGFITLATSAVNTYSVTYTTNGPCPETKTVNLTIVGSADATFNYAAAPYCQYAANAFPIFPSGSSAGTFSATPAGLNFVNTSTGEVNLMTSTPGTYEVTNTIAAGNGCVANSKKAFITIAPAPVLNVTSGTTPAICTGTQTNITLTGASTYDWTAVAPGTITGASDVTGDATGVIAQTLTTSDVVPGVVHYIVTPKSSGGCIGKSDSIHVTVNPVPTVNATPVTPSVCSGIKTNINLTSNIPTATFSWTITAATGATGAKTGSGNIITDTLTATGAIPGTVTYQITPSAFGTCNGTPISVTVTVNPKPVTVITITPSNKIICSGQKTNIQLNSNTTGTVFTWTANQTGVTGGTNGTGNIISDSLIAIGATQGKVVYTITGTANSCAGVGAIDSVLVNPIPTLKVTPLNQSICSGSSTNIALVSNLSGTTFSWKVKPTAVTGAADGSTTVGNIIQVLTNPATVTDTVIYHIVATAGGCSSDMANLTDSVEAKITVNPKPSITATTPTSICSGDTTNIFVNTSVTGALFTYKATTITVQGAGDGTGDTIRQVLKVDAVPDSVTYTITATSAEGCISNPFQAKVYVGQRPVITYLPTSSQAICSGSPVSVYLVSNVPGSVINWTPRPSDVSGTKTGTAVSPAYITDVLTTSGDTAASVIYDVTATAPGGCTNSTISSLLQFTINPKPTIIPLVASNTICDGDSVFVALSSNVKGTDFNWSITQTGVTGASADSANTEIRDPLKLTGTAIGTVVYTITANSPTGCKSSTSHNVVITVNPLENAAFKYSSAKYCQNEPDPTAMILDGNPGTFSALPTGLVLTNINTGNINLMASIPGSYNIQFKTSGKCSQTSFQSININPVPFADTNKVVIGDANCGNSVGSITGITIGSGTPPFTYEWKNSSGTIVDTLLLLDSVLPGYYTLKVTDYNGCNVTVGNGKTLDVKNIKSVTAAFTSDVNDGELPLPVQFTNLSTHTGSVINYNWNFDNGTTSILKDPAVTFDDIKQYNVCLIVDDGGKGCKDTACAIIDVFTNFNISIVPNVFTPNGDGINDILKITATGIGAMNAQIFNRWGQKEYEWNTVNGGWDGRTASGIEAVEGTYYIILNAVGADKKKTAWPTIKQSFTLLR